jgi:tetratricopeptide (TPR) repeat protein
LARKGKRVTPTTTSGVWNDVRELCRSVRQGRFLNARELADTCWNSRDHFGSETQRLLIHTLNWEVYEALGEYAEAAARLRSDGIADECAKLIQNEIRHHKAFTQREFPSTLDPEKRRERYRLWRQRVMVLLADAIAADRQFSPHPRQLLDDALTFLDKCLAPAGFPCNGTRCRHQYFSAILHHHAEEFAEANHACKESARYCDARLQEHLAQEGRQDDEAAFATYCLAKLHVKHAEIKVDQGYLRQASDLLDYARVLLRTTQDQFLASRAELLACRIIRLDKDIKQEGRALVDRIKSCRQELAAHSLFAVQAGVEEVTAAVYLLSKKSPPEPHDYDTALTTIKSLITKAAAAGAPGVSLHFLALLVKARIHIRQDEYNTARQTINEALDLYRRDDPREQPPASLSAEARFVEGRTHLHEGHYEPALECFRQALKDQHASNLFNASCQLRVLEIHLRQKHFARAKTALRDCKRTQHRVESNYFNTRLEILEQEFHDAHVLTIQFQSPFDLRTTIDELEQRYLVFLAAYINRELHELLLPAFWRRLKQAHIVTSKQHVIILLKRHFPEAYRASRREAKSHGRRTPTKPMTPAASIDPQQRLVTNI